MESSVAQAEQPGTEAKAKGRKRGPHPQAGKYVVLAAKPEEDTDTERKAEEAMSSEKPAPKPGGFVEVGIFSAASAKEAKQKAVKSSETLEDAVRDLGVFLAAVPAMSWNPTLVRAEQPPPILSGL